MNLHSQRPFHLRSAPHQSIAHAWAIGKVEASETRKVEASETRKVQVSALLTGLKVRRRRKKHVITQL